MHDVFDKQQSLTDYTSQHFFLLSISFFFSRHSRYPRLFLLRVIFLEWKV